METKLVVSSHAVGESNYHIQLTPAYRQDIFSDPLVAELTLAYMAEKLQKNKVILTGYGYGPNHMHLFVSNVRFVSEIKLVQLIKGFSSRMMRKDHWYMFHDKLWGKKFWSEGHFYRSVGAVTKESMQWYVTEGQKRHWKKCTYEQYQQIKNQKLLSQFN